MYMSMRGRCIDSPVSSCLKAVSWASMTSFIEMIWRTTWLWMSSTYTSFRKLERRNDRPRDQGRVVHAELFAELQAGVGAHHLVEIAAGNEDAGVAVVQGLEHDE